MKERTKREEMEKAKKRQLSEGVLKKEHKVSLEAERDAG